MTHKIEPIAPINPEGLDDIAEALLREDYQPIQTPNIITLDNLQIEEKSPREGNNIATQLNS